MDMSRIRIEGLLAAFPKLVGSGKQHTFIETENVRYVYQPMEVSLKEENRHIVYAARSLLKSDLAFHSGSVSSSDHEQAKQHP